MKKYDWQRCDCGSQHYIGNQKEGNEIWCPLCLRTMIVRKGLYTKTEQLYTNCKRTFNKYAGLLGKEKA